MSDEAKKKELSEELQELFYRANHHFLEAQGYLEAAYFCCKDLQRYEDSEIVSRLLIQIEAALVRENRQMNTSLKTLKTLLKDALGVEVGIPDEE